jgi:hypothetical protein
MLIWTIFNIIWVSLLEDTPNLNVIDKFPFATNSNATDVGDLTQGRYRTGAPSLNNFTIFYHGDILCKKYL